MAQWIRCVDQLPMEGEEVWTKIDDQRGVRNKQVLYRHNGLWFTVGGMYVYYTPTHWMPR